MKQADKIGKALLKLRIYDLCDCFHELIIQRGPSTITEIAMSSPAERPMNDQDFATKPAARFDGRRFELKL